MSKAVFFCPRASTLIHVSDLCAQKNIWVHSPDRSWFVVGVEVRPFLFMIESDALTNGLMLGRNARTILFMRESERFRSLLVVQIFVFKT